MEKSIQTSLCKGLRACGVRKKESLEIQNTLIKWYDSNGPEWTLKRIKDLRQWYETSLSGNPQPPSWFAHGKDMLPLGIWKRVFELPIPKALGVLSCGTILYEKHLSETQKKKFFHGLEGNGCQNWQEFRSLVDRAWREPIPWKHKPKSMPKLHFPTIFDMNGSVPVHNGRSSIQTENKLGRGLKALEQSWESIPQVTFQFLDRMGLLDYMPPAVLGNQYQLELDKPHCSCVGRIGIIQEPELKARVVANPNRVTQVTLEPLKEVYMNLVREVPMSCIHDQESGMQWVRRKLAAGVTMAGSDLTSASDLLDLDMCLELIDRVWDLSRIKGYQDFVEYYREVSRANWYFKPTDSEVSWKQGDPLGTGPSIGILDLANGTAGLTAVQLAIQDGVLPQPSHKGEGFDYLRVLGDDICMDARIAPYYEKVIQSMGGEINHSKTLTSDKVAEFAGRVIVPTNVFLKKIKYNEPSDVSFMDYMSQLGDQAKFFLKPRQRRAYEFFKYVPGYLVDGPWLHDSLGEPLGTRYQWYLTEVEPALRRLEPDLTPEQAYQYLLLKADLSLAEANETVNEEMVNPFTDDGYLPSQVRPSFKAGGDPRLPHGVTVERRLNDAIDSGRIQPYRPNQDTKASDATSCDLEAGQKLTNAKLVVKHHFLFGSARQVLDLEQTLVRPKTKDSETRNGHDDDYGR